MAFYSEEIIEEVRSANDIVDVVSNYVQLKRNGSNYFGLCPFHREKTPSFSVASEKQIFHCFGCGKGGNVIKFVMGVENISFVEAIQMLAERAKIDLPSNDTRDLYLSQDELLQKEQSKKNMYEINKLAGRFFYENIKKSKVDQEYIIKRSIDRAKVRKFGLCFHLVALLGLFILCPKGFNINFLFGLNACIFCSYLK